MMLLGYLGKPSATVTYSITNADLTEHTAETGTGVVTLKEGTPLWLYVVNVASPPIGGVIHWYEGGAYITSETIAQPDAAIAGDAMTLTAAYDAAKAAASQTSVDAIPTTPLLADDYVEPDNATIAAIALKAASLTDATGTLPIEFTLLLDVDGDGADVPAVPIADARCIVYADEALTTPLSEARNTDTAGYVRWDGYAAGTYWVKPDKAGYRFTAVEVTAGGVTPPAHSA